MKVLLVLPFRQTFVESDVMETFDTEKDVIVLDFKKEKLPLEEQGAEEAKPDYLENKRFVFKKVQVKEIKKESVGVYVLSEVINKEGEIL